MFGEIASDRTHPDSSTDEEMTYGYDKNNRLLSMYYPDNLIGEEQVGYDSVGNILWYRQDNKDETWTTTLYHYDGLHRLDGVYYEDDYTGPFPPVDTYGSGVYDGLTPDVTIEYEGYSGLVSEIEDAVGTTTFTYDEFGQLETYSQPSGPTLTYTYNGLGQKSSISSTSGYNVQYNYYANGLLKSVTTDSGSTTLAEYTYNDEDTRVDYGNGTYTTCSFDDDPRYFLTNISHYKEGTPDTLLMEIDYTERDNTGNPEGITDAVGDWDYTYGADGRLTNATPPTGPIPDQPMGGDYGYDWVGNRATPPADPNEMVYNAVDQLTSWPGMYDYSYDAAGNLKEVRNAQGVLVASYTYDDSGLLETATYPDGSMTNTWDATGKRIGLTVGEDEYSFVYDPMAGVPAVIEEETPGGTVQYFRTPGGALIVRKKSTEWRYYHYDELGSTRLLTDGSGNVTDTYSYDAYGNVTSHNGITTDNPYQYVGSLGYYTHCQCPEVKLLQLGFRFYDTETGRFTQSDPAKNGLNWYAYCGNPLSGVDPWGLWDYWNPVDWAKGAYNLGYLAGSHAKAWVQNGVIFAGWATGIGPNNVYYGQNSVRTWEIRQSEGVAAARRLAQNPNNEHRYAQRTRPAYWETARKPWNATVFQVGAYNVKWKYNSNGTITYTVTNELTPNSLLGHYNGTGVWLTNHHIPNLLDNIPARWTSGPMGSVFQTYQWTEDDPCK